MISWLDGPSEGLLLIGRQQGFLPPYFQQVNRQGIEVRILSAQGVVITLRIQNVSGVAGDFRATMFGQVAE